MTRHPTSSQAIDQAHLRAAVARSTPWREASTGGEAIAAALQVARAAPQELLDRLDGAGRIVISGAGSSFYIAQVAAWAMREHAGLPAEAQPLSEMLLRPAGVAAGIPLADQPLVVVSRSGSTTEALEVLRAARARGQYSVAVTCRPAAPMAALADTALAVPEGDEDAIVMTRSFASQATLLMRLGARLGDPAFAADLEALPARWPGLAPLTERAFELAASAPSRLVVLGGGAAFGLANEAVLKATETGQIPAAAFHPFEFRHGPISVCEPGVLVVGLVGGAAGAEESRVLDESAALGATTWALGPEAPTADLEACARVPLLLHALQALAFGIAAGRGRDPEAPRHLGQVVVLGDE